jgi:hypothetical protein
MPSITTWTRVQSQVRDPSMTVGLQARVHDPMWLLTRQWQLAEFKADNGGTPVKVEVDAEFTRITAYVAGRPEVERPAGALRKYDARTPLEVLVEREGGAASNDTGADVTHWHAAEAGLQFLRTLGPLAPRYRAGYVARYRMVSLPGERRDGIDMMTDHFIELMSERVPDGAALYRDTGGAANGTLPEQPAIEPADRDAVLRAIVAWRAWYDGLYPAPAPEDAWVSQRLEHEFALGAASTASPTGEAVLTVAEYWGGHLDWPSFDIELDPQRSLQSAAERLPAPPAVLPTPVRFRGMPAPRFWQFEDAHVNFGGIEAGPEDLAHLLLIEFALVYGNDFFVIPIDLDVGTLCRTNHLWVTDTFNDRTRILSSSRSDGEEGAWRMYGLSRDRRSRGTTRVPDLYFLPPVLGPSLHGAAIEDVLFLRDEMANLVWAVERIVEGPGGRPLNRAEAYQASRPEPPAATSATPQYRLVTQVPEYWFPLLPVRIEGSDRQVVFQRHLYDGPTPWGRIIDAGGPPSLTINEEEVPRAGARVTRAWQYARWSDGSTHLWVGRRKQVGRGEGSSGLRFDTLESH